MHSPASTSNLRRFLALSSSERRLLFEAWWCLLAAAMRLRLAPRRAVAAALAEAASPVVHRESAGDSEQVALAVSRAAAHHLLPMTCLPRALALRRMLARRGFSSRLRIGVRKESGGVAGIAAHAWIEVDGMALGEPEAIEERFQPLLPPLTGPSYRPGQR